MTFNDLRALMVLMRQQGCAILEHEGTKIVLGPDPVSSGVMNLRNSALLIARQQNMSAPPDAVSAALQTARAEDAGELTEDQILFASSLGWPNEGDQ